MMVTPEAPVKAVKNAHAIKTTRGTPPRDAAEQGLRQTGQPLRGFAFGHDKARESEQRYRQQGGCAGHPIQFYENGGGIYVRIIK